MSNEVEFSTDDKVCVTCLQTYPYDKFMNKGKKFVESTGKHHIYRGPHCDSCRAEKRRAQYTPERGRKANVSRNGISLDQYNEMLVKQSGGCAICGTTEAKNAKGTKYLVIDHCHDTNKVRGLLCSPCNIACGMLADDPARAIMAAEYLKDHSDV